MTGATRTFPGEQENGDSWAVTWHDGVCRIALVDGLGHGPGAAAASGAARTVLLQHPELSPEQSILACHRALAGSRGAVALIVNIDVIRKTLAYAGIGNVEARLVQSGTEQHLVSFRGIVGSSVPKVRTFNIDLEPEWLLVIHSDGVSDRFDLEDWNGAKDSIERSAMAASILERWGRHTDDATVLIASPNGRTP